MDSKALQTAIRRAVRSHWALMRTVARLRRFSGRSPARGTIVMFHVGRCGSTVLASMLNQNPEVRWGGELFDLIWHKVPRFRSGSEQWVRAVIEFDMHQARCGYYGFETKPMHFGTYGIDMGLAEYVALLRSMGIDNFIVLTRSNLLRVVASAGVAARLGKLHERSSEPSRPTSVAIDASEPFGSWGGSLLNVLGIFERFYAELDAPLAGARRLDVNYETEVERDPIVGYRKICEFLEVQPLAPEIRFKRTNPFRLEEMIANYQEVSEVLRGTRFEWMLSA